MAKQSTFRRPKTHSDILWHFTGGPLWNKKSQKQSVKLKSHTEAFEALIQILKSRMLHVGNYHEVIKCRVPQDKFYNKKTKQIDTKKNALRSVRTSPVCCVADIPLLELFHHARRYGKIAIGFKRSSLVNASFNPVFYTLQDTEIILNFYSAQNALQQTDCGIEGAIGDLEGSLSEIEYDHSCDDGNPWEPDENAHCSHDIDTNDISSAVDSMTSYIDEALNNLENTLAFIKTFDRSEFDTIYSEREWRSVSPFKFKWSDVSALILPKKNGYYEKFIDEFYKSLKIPKAIKLYRWEDIDVKE